MDTPQIRIESTGATDTNSESTGVTASKRQGIYEEMLSEKEKIEDEKREAELAQFNPLAQAQSLRALGDTMAANNSPGAYSLRLLMESAAIQAEEERKQQSNTPNSKKFLDSPSSKGRGRKTSALNNNRKSGYSSPLSTPGSFALEGTSSHSKTGSAHSSPEPAGVNSSRGSESDGLNATTTRSSLLLRTTDEGHASDSRAPSPQFASTSGTEHEVDAFGATVRSLGSTIGGGGGIRVSPSNHHRDNNQRRSSVSSNYSVFTASSQAKMSSNQRGGGSRLSRMHSTTSTKSAGAASSSSASSRAWKAKQYVGSAQHITFGHLYKLEDFLQKRNLSVASLKGQEAVLQRALLSSGLLLGERGRRWLNRHLTVDLVRSMNMFLNVLDDALDYEKELCGEIIDKLVKQDLEKMEERKSRSVNGGMGKERKRDQGKKRSQRDAEEQDINSAFGAIEIIKRCQYEGYFTPQQVQDLDRHLLGLVHPQGCAVIKLFSETINKADSGSYKAKKQFNYKQTKEKLRLEGSSSTKTPTAKFQLQPGAPCYVPPEGAHYQIALGPEYRTDPRQRTDLPLKPSKQTDEEEDKPKPEVYHLMNFQPKPPLVTRSYTARGSRTAGALETVEQVMVKRMIKNAHESTEGIDTAGFAMLGSTRDANKGSQTARNYKLNTYRTLADEEGGGSDAPDQLAHVMMNLKIIASSNAAREVEVANQKSDFTQSYAPTESRADLRPMEASNGLQGSCEEVRRSLYTPGFLEERNRKVRADSARSTRRVQLSKRKIEEVRCRGDGITNVNLDEVNPGKFIREYMKKKEIEIEQEQQKATVHLEFSRRESIIREKRLTEMTQRRESLLAERSLKIGAQGGHELQRGDSFAQFNRKASSNLLPPKRPQLSSSSGQNETQIFTEISPSSEGVTPLSESMKGSGAKAKKTVPAAPLSEVVEVPEFDENGELIEKNPRKNPHMLRKEIERGVGALRGGESKRKMSLSSSAVAASTHSQSSPSLMGVPPPIGGGERVPMLTPLSSMQLLDIIEKL